MSDIAFFFFLIKNDSHKLKNLDCESKKWYIKQAAEILGNIFTCLHVPCIYGIYLQFFISSLILQLADKWNCRY